MSWRPKNERRHGRLKGKGMVGCGLGWEEEERRVSQIVGAWSAGLLPPSLSPQAGLGKGPPP